jgi:PKD repeat protein
MFTFATYGNVTLAPTLSARASCFTSVGPFADCQAAPVVLKEGGLSYLAWNWSTNPSENILRSGDHWSATLTIVARGGPFGDVPIDRCSAPECTSVEIGSSGVFSGLLLQGSSGTGQFVSFPLATIAVSGPPRLSVGVSVLPVAPMVDENAFFLAKAGGGAAPYSYNWSFGDGATSTWTSPEHTYTHPGTYTVTVRVLDRAGQTAQASFTVPVGSVPLTTSLIVDRSVTTVGEAVQFAGAASGGFSVLTYAWSGLPGGCSTQNASMISCLPAASGSFVVSMEVSDVVGDHQTSSVALIVNPAVHASVVTTSSAHCNGGAVAAMTFTANVTGGTPTYLLYWTFGDGVSAAGSFPVSHTYARAGAYVVNVLVTDSAGATSNGTVVVHTNTPSGCPVSSLSQGPVSGPMIGMLVIALAVVGAGAVAIILLARRSR